MKLATALQMLRISIVIVRVDAKHLDCGGGASSATAFV
jgi:hypothetical protein